MYDVISLKIEKLMTLNFACLLKYDSKFSAPNRKIDSFSLP